MAVTLVVNPGSSSKRYSLYKDGRVVLSMQYERNADEFGVCRVTQQGDATCQAIAGDIYRNALRNMLDECVYQGHIENLKEIERAGLRIVVPGSYFTKHKLIDQEYLRNLRLKEVTSPLHVPHTRQEMESLLRELPFCKLVAASDSAFHTTMPFVAHHYSIDRNDAKQYDVYRFGYDGLSVASIARRVPHIYGELPSKTIVCHIGDGVSITALKDGKSIDTTMGFSPVSGLVMGTRAGDIEAGALLELSRARRLRGADAHAYISASGGMKGVCGEGDMRRVLDKHANGDQAAAEALDLFSYHITKAIGSFVTVLEGVDLIVLTAAAAERNPEVRKVVLRGVMKPLNISIDENANDVMVGREGTITHHKSGVPVLVMKTDEMGEIARIAEELAGDTPSSP